MKQVVRQFQIDSTNYFVVASIGANNSCTVWVEDENGNAVNGYSYTFHFSHENKANKNGFMFFLQDVGIHAMNDAVKHKWGNNISLQNVVEKINADPEFHEIFKPEIPGILNTIKAIIDSISEDTKLSFSFQAYNDLNCKAILFEKDALILIGIQILKEFGLGLIECYSSEIETILEDFNRAAECEIDFIVYKKLIFVSSVYIALAHELSHILQKHHNEVDSISEKEEEKRADMWAGMSSINVVVNIKEYTKKSFPTLNEDIFEKIVLHIVMLGAMYYPLIIARISPDNSESHPSHTERSIISAFELLEAACNLLKHPAKNLLENAIFIYSCLHHMDTIEVDGLFKKIVKEIYSDVTNSTQR